MEIEEREVSGFNVKRVTINNLILGIATEIGPRILYLAGDENPDFNLFGVLPEFGVQTSEGLMRIYGGHRLWSSPEQMPRSYSRDDNPVKVKVNGESITVYGNPENENSIQKKITLRPFSDNGIQVIHIIQNIGRWPIQLSCWALSLMRQSGFAIIPLKPSKADKEGLLPDRHISLWPYTNISDKRIKFTEDYIFVIQDPKLKNPIKIGTMANPSWIAYWVNGMMFVKVFSCEDSEYTDFGCNVEVYTNADMLELETLGPLKLLNPSKCIQHTEIWKVFKVGKLTPDIYDIRQKLLKNEMDKLY